MMNEYILKAIETVERNAARGRARLAVERDAERMLASSAQASDDGAGVTSTLSAVEAGIGEMERIGRQAAAARADFARVYGDGAESGEAAA